MKFPGEVLSREIPSLAEGSCLSSSNARHAGRNLRVRFSFLTAVLAFCLLLAGQVFGASDPAVLHIFGGGNDGSYPYASLSADGAGNLYGTTQNGGAYGAGTVFQLSPRAEGGWRFSLVYAFTGAADGGYPLGSLRFDAAGNAYTTVSGGGTYGLGAVVELTPPAHPSASRPWSEKVLYSFQGGRDGAIPFGNVVFDATGSLYGTTSIGGVGHIGCPPAKGCGTVYKLSPTKNGIWREQVLRRFTDAFNQGAEPRAGVVFDAAGNLYGTTYEGGNNLYCNGYGCGSVFELVRPTSGKHWRFVSLVDFDGSNGALLRAGLTINASGTLFGATLYGGTYNDGTVFSMTEESGRWQLQTLYNFGGLDGLQPAGTLALDEAGNIYGTTYEGGAFDWGEVFQLVPGGDGWTENVIYNFTVSGKRFGASPLDGVLLDEAGNLFLTTNQGGNINDCQPNAGCGTVIELSSGTER